MDVVKLDFPDRDLYILKDGDWRGYRSSACAKEPETVEWIRSFEVSEDGIGEFMWDVGASVGSYTLIAAALGHQVDAFEPFAPSYGHLWQNIWLNFQEQANSTVRAFPTMLGAETDRNRGYLYLSDISAGAASHSGKLGQNAVIESADDCLSPAPDHVKIDVDGAELGVIEGGRETWKRVKSIMVESEPPTIDDITVILGGAGLQLVDSWKRMGDTKQRNYLFRRETTV